MDGKSVELEFAAGAEETNLEDLLVVVDAADLPNESAPALRSLQH